jgi:arsenite/tail-anchored protein-transporting ATPase
MRIILYTGKGGVGKTSVAAATALRCAELGYKTIVISTDPAHSLADSLDMTIGAAPVEIAPNLWGQEVDIYHEIKNHWGTLQKYLLSLLSWRGMDDVVAEEMSVFPGMEELASLVLITRYARAGAYDVIIVDAAPTGETLRLLSFPEVSSWWLRNMFPMQRRVYQVVRPVVRPFTDMPLPGDDVVNTVKDFLEELDDMHTLLSDRDVASIRLVLNPEKMVVKETQRTFTYLNLYGYGVDLVVCNRMLPATITDEYFANWKGIQEKYYQLVEEAFTPLPIETVPWFDQEVVGKDMLRLMAKRLFGDSDPSKIMFKGRAHTIEKDSEGYILTVPLPFAEKEQLELVRAGEDLFARVGSQRRNIMLPRALLGLEVAGAKFENGVLRVRFVDPGARRD